MKKAEYLELLAPIVDDYRTHGYSFWRRYLSGPPIVFEIETADASKIFVEISSFWDDKPDGNIRVIALIDDGGWRAFVPITDSFIIAPDGTFVGE